MGLGEGGSGDGAGVGLGQGGKGAVEEWVGATVGGSGKGRV